MDAPGGTHAAGRKGQESTGGGGEGAGADGAEGVLVRLVREFGDSVRLLGEYAAWRRRDAATVRLIAGGGFSGVSPARVDGLAVGVRRLRWLVGQCMSGSGITFVKQPISFVKAPEFYNAGPSSFPGRISDPVTVKFEGFFYTLCPEQFSSRNTPPSLYYHDHLRLFLIRHWPTLNHAERLSTLTPKPQTPHP